MRQTIYRVLLIATVPFLAVSVADAKTLPLSSYFPSPHAYPAGYQVMPLRIYHQPLDLFASSNAQLAAREHFVIGGTQVAVSKQGTVVAITIARFRSVRDAVRFSLLVQPDVTTQDTHGITHALGAGEARYVSGSCASCGPGAPKLSQLFFARGPLFVEIGVQPSDLHLAQQLGRVIDTKLKRSLTTNSHPKSTRR
jgi:hypothetical protein